MGFQQTVHQLGCGFHPLDCRARFSFNGCLMDCTPTQLNCAFIHWVSNRWCTHTILFIFLFIMFGVIEFKSL
jgi:23S rRNA C2498 (ribose-2'-O)-methylase RlmM